MLAMGNEFLEYAPFLIPLVLIQLGLQVFTLVHIFRHNQYRVGNRIIWVIISVVFQVIGCVLYLTIGREEE